MKKMMTIAAMMLITLSASAKDNKHQTDTLVVTTTPVMHCENCENKIKSNIRFVSGTKKIDTSIPQQKVTIVYDARKASLADYLKAFKKIGYEAKQIDAKQK